MTLAFLVNHLFLPPKLPQEDDSSSGGPQALLSHVRKSATAFLKEIVFGDKNVDVDIIRSWSRLQKTFRWMDDLHVQGLLPLESLHGAISGMDVDDVLVLHIAAQNAGVIIRKPTTSYLTLEFFQASPTAAAVTSTAGKLIIQFPSRPRLSFPTDPSAIQSLSALLVDLNSTEMPDAIPVTQKAGKKQPEIREVADFRYVSELLGGIVRAFTDDARGVAATTTYVTKRIDDHVLWDKCLLPWRRCPYWLIIRVTLQTTLKEWKIDARYGYKVFTTFVLSRLLDQALSSNLSHDILFTMNAKLAIRVSKLQPDTMSSPFISEIARVNERCGLLLQREWDEIQAAEARPSAWKAPTSSEIEAAKVFPLIESASYLSQVFNRGEWLSQQRGEFYPPAFESSLQNDSTSSANLWEAILGVERWVSKMAQRHDESRFEILKETILRFDDLISSFRATNPELFSRTLLTQMELWVALDRVVIEEIPLLSEYSPELPINFLEPLLLPTLDQMRRLQVVEQYLQERIDQARYSHLSLFKFVESSDAFAVRYFDTDSSLPVLRSDILLEAIGDRDSIRRQCRERNAEYDRLTKLAGGLSCTYVESYDRWGDVISQHSSSCRKCVLEHKAKNLTAPVHEWPLPENEILSKLVIFELCPPQYFIGWRDITYTLSRRYSPEGILESQPSPTVVLHDYPALSAYCSNRSPGITLASTTKSFLKAHYSSRKVPCAESDVIKNHGLRYELFDSASCLWVSNATFSSMNIRNECLSRLPQGPYRELEWSVIDTKHTSNMVIARQSLCPDSLSYHEWDAFGHVRAGNRLQWRNITLQLVRGVLDLGNPAIYILLRQAAWQAEAALPSSPLRDAHIDFSQAEFCEELLAVIEDCSTSISENWQEGWAASTLVLIGCRLFTLTKESHVKNGVKQLFQFLRHTLSTWLAQVLRLMKDSTGSKVYTPEARVELRDRTIQVATTCRATYTLEDTDTIFEPMALSTFIDSALVLQSVSPPNTSELSEPLRYLLERDAVLSVEVADMLRSAIHDDNESLDEAIRRNTWQAFRRDSQVRWKAVDHRWMTCRTSAEAGARVRHVYFNIVDGTFLVDGKAINRLPKDIQSHGLFQALFPDQLSAEIVPSTMEGMDYQLSANLKDQEVHLALHEQDLLIRIRDSHGMSEFIHPHKCQNDLPVALLHNMHLVFEEQSRTVRFYPDQSGWDPSISPKWSMDLKADPCLPGSKQPSIVSVPPGTSVLSPHSGVVYDLHTIFIALESMRTDLLATTCQYQVSQWLEVSLPRYNLHFSIDDCGYLECRDLPGFFLSPVQSIGTLFWLESKLVLRNNDNPDLRKIIIPFGTVTSTNVSYTHPVVTVAPYANPNIRSFIYDVDGLIGRLSGDGTLSSWFMLVHLHILTSSWLKDPLLQNTGIQEALKMLRSANSFSFMELDEEHKEILTNISNIQSVPQYYPEHLRSMETISWNSDLSPLIQIQPFARLVGDIFEHGKHQQLFHDNGVTLSLEQGGQDTLRERAEFRHARLVLDDITCLREKVKDVIYTPERCLESPTSLSTKTEQAVAEMTELVRQWPSSVIDTPPRIWKHMRTWGTFTSRVDPNTGLNSFRVWLTASPNTIWFTLLSLCENCSRATDLHAIAFALGILAYRSDFDSQLSRSLLAVAIHKFKAPIINASEFQPRLGRCPKLKDIRSLAKQHCIPYSSNHDQYLSREFGESNRSFRSRCMEAHERKCDDQCDSIANLLLQSWPCPSPQMPTHLSKYNLINLAGLNEECQFLFSTRHANHCLREQMTILEGKIRGIMRNQSRSSIPPRLAQLPPDPRLPSYRQVTLRMVMNNRSPVMVPPVVLKSMQVSSTQNQDTSDPSAIRDLVTKIPDVRKAPAERTQNEEEEERWPYRSAGSCGFTTRYTEDLLLCIKALENHRLPVQTTYSITKSQPGLTNSPHNPDSVLSAIQECLGPTSSDASETMLLNAGLWPSISTERLLDQLSLHSRPGLSYDWQQTLTWFAEETSAHQRSIRLRELFRLGLFSEYRKEMENNGDQVWDAMMYPDWLLIQLDADILIRPVQAQVAKEMMSPREQTNTVMQLNMGDGKSSTIVPIVSAALADSEQLVRVIVLKPLCPQMFKLLRHRICRLSNRRIFYLPFSRDIKLDDSKICTIVTLFKECARVGGVLLCQPEHILSFELMGLHTLCREEGSLGTKMLLDAQEWLNGTSRDILDESDEILSVKYQLVYTVGMPQGLHGQSTRWQTVQEVLSLLRSILTKQSGRFTAGVELKFASSDRSHSTSFPRTRILASRCGHELMQTIARQIIFEERMKSTPFRSYPDHIRDIALRFLVEVMVSPEECLTLEQYSGEYFEQILLLRGLLAGGILLHNLKEKRWRVDYGLDPTRSMLAVPYRAKDSPALRAEFGHPEMILVLTCLSYYYGGLTNDQMEITFYLLFATDSPDLRYEDWVKAIAHTLPEHLRSLRRLNLNDVKVKHDGIFPALRYNKLVIDFYLSECVFPKEAKEFQHKLTTNSWDLARKKLRPTTGFSGTNDHSYLLPLSMHQLNAESQRHTNAHVLGYLLRSENRTVIHTDRATASGLIQRVVDEQNIVMVLLDVGAQVLELPNGEVVSEWLQLEKRAPVEAAIYCDAKDEFCVVTRDGRHAPLATSVYKSQLHKCLVYLDEAHTRGTDFKFPAGTRAIVTLGPNTVKDKLVQGCMRMRKLGSEHSVAFFASDEIRRKVASCVNKSNEDTLDSRDVLLWALRQTCAHIVKDGALWASQGENFDHRCRTWKKFQDGTSSLSEVRDALLEPGARSLEELYSVQDEFHQHMSNGISELQQAIYSKCEDFGFRPGRGSALLEEQERELSHEMEEERQVERTKGAEPLGHHLDPALRILVESGQYPKSFKYISLSRCLHQTSKAVELRGISNAFLLSDGLRATKDFSLTIQLSRGDHNDDFLRPVQWILTTTRCPQVLLLISPFEANELLPSIRKSKYASLHIYSARTSRAVRSFENLDFFTVPPRAIVALPYRHTIHELNLFAGQLFFRDQVSFKETCSLLGLHLSEIPEKLRGEIDVTGFIKSEQERRRRGAIFKKNPVSFLRELVGWRRKGQGFILTHVGLMLHGNNPSEDEFEGVDVEW